MRRRVGCAASMPFCRFVIKSAIVPSDPCEARSPRHAGPRLSFSEAASNVQRRMPDEKRRLLEQAERCRRIAQSTTDAETVAMLLCLARSYEAKAAQLPSPH